MNKKLELAFYFLAGLVLYFVLLVVVFPYDALKSRVLSEIEKNLGGKYSLRVEEMDISILGNLSFEKLKLIKRGKNGDQVIFTSPKVKIGASLLSYLSSKKVDLDFYLEGIKGDLEGELLLDQDHTKVELEFDDFDIRGLEFLKALTEQDISMVGVLDGEMDLDLDFKNPEASEGNLDIKFIDLSLLPVKQGDKELFPRMRLSKKKGSGLKGKMEKGEFKLENFALQGGDLDLSLSGVMKLAKRGFRFRYNLEGQFIFSPGFEKQKPISDISQLLSYHKNEKGVYPLSIQGFKPDIYINKFNLRNLESMLASF